MLDFEGFTWMASKEMRRAFLRLFGIFTNQRHENEMAREIESHLVLLEDEFVRQGLSRQDARAAAPGLSRAFRQHLRSADDAH